jgi:intracellular septation protein A
MTDRERDALKEALKYEVEVLKFLALLTAGLGGGTLTLVLGDFTFLRIGLAALGFLGTILLAVADWYLHRHIRALIAQLKENP